MSIQNTIKLQGRVYGWMLGVSTTVFAMAWKDGSGYKTVVGELKSADDLNVVKKFMADFFHPLPAEGDKRGVSDTPVQLRPKRRSASRPISSVFGLNASPSQKAPPRKNAPPSSPLHTPSSHSVQHFPKGVEAKYYTSFPAPSHSSSSEQLQGLLAQARKADNTRPCYVYVTGTTLTLKFITTVPLLRSFSPTTKIVGDSNSSREGDWSTAAGQGRQDRCHLRTRR